MLKKISEIFHKPQPANKLVYTISAILIIIVLAISMGVRYNQLSVWKQNKQAFFATGTPMTTTLDAYKFLRHAKEYKEGTFNPSVKDKMIFYPDNSPFPDPVPLLSVILSKFADITGMDLYNASTYLLPVISSLFIIPLALYFIFIGLPALGILGGMVTAFAPMYFMRSGMGRLDTDGGILFFLFSASIFVLLAMKASSKKNMFIFSGVLGLVMWLFYTWYHHGMFNLFYLAILIICLAISKFKVKDIAYACIIYLICANPIYTYYAFSQLAHAINVYIFKVKVGADAIFPNVYHTIGEAGHDPFWQVLANVTVNPSIAVIGFIGCILLVIGYFKYMIPLLPLAALCAMAFISAGRFSMFMGPIIGAGLAYLCVFLFSYVTFKSAKVKMLFMTLTPFAAIIIIAVAMNIGGVTAIKLILPPSINPKTYQVFKDMKTELPRNSAIYTWWDYGLAVADTAGFPVFHSGMTQETPKTWIIAKSFISDEQTLYNIVSYLDNYGVAEIEYMAKDNATLEEIEKHIYSYNEGPSNNNDFVMITEDMVSKFPAIAYLATWRPDAETNPDILLQRMICNKENLYSLNCSGNKFDLQLGLTNGRTPIKKLLTFNNGKIESEKDYNFSQGLYLFITAARGDKAEIYVLNEKAFNTSFVRLYFMNKPNPELFRLAVDKYPYARIFKVLKKNKAE